jgi:hypothetical protein
MIANKYLRIILCLAGLLAVNSALYAATTPLTTPLPDGQIVEIECEYKPVKGDERVPGSQGMQEEDPRKSSKTGPFHYRVYIPNGYNGSKDRHWPCLFIASPGGNADMGVMKDRLTRDRWVVVMLVESQNGSPDWLKNFMTAHDDAVQRLHILDGMKFGTGMSGGARCASVWPEMRKGFRGLFMQSAGFFGSIKNFRYPREEPELVFYVSFGTTDMNLYESKEFRRELPPATCYCIWVFEGGHAWAPVNVVENAFDWLEQKVFFEAHPNPQYKDAYLWFCENLMKRFDTAKAPFAKYEFAEQLTKAANRLGLAAHADLKERLASCALTLRQLEKDDGIKKELTARRAYLAIEQTDDPPMNATPKPKASPLPTLAAEYEKLAKTFEGTVYGGKAQQRAASLHGEINCPKK